MGGIWRGDAIAAQRFTHRSRDRIAESETGAPSPCGRKTSSAVDRGAPGSPGAARPLFVDNRASHEKNRAMPENSNHQNLIDENRILTQQAKKALLKAIIEFAPNATMPDRIEDAARAFAIVVGLGPGGGGVA
jgi:hypothetical protein